MCPGCVAAISVIVAGVVSTGGVAALVAQVLGRNNGKGEASGEEVVAEQVEGMSLETKEKRA